MKPATLCGCRWPLLVAAKELCPSGKLKRLGSFWTTTRCRQSIGSAALQCPRRRFKVATEGQSQAKDSFRMDFEWFSNRFLCVFHVSARHLRWKVWLLAARHEQQQVHGPRALAFVRAELWDGSADACRRRPEACCTWFSMFWVENRRFWPGRGAFVLVVWVGKACLRALFEGAKAPHEPRGLHNQPARLLAQARLDAPSRMQAATGPRSCLRWARWLYVWNARARRSS